MFRLEKVLISGFKSFCDPAELQFPERLTAVVGPNGCGKSNISDAIIWVLGERRASHLRGGKMEDVIFKGSSRRRALGMGEVELTLSSSNGHPHTEDGRITIQRRVFQNGESEFRLNGKRVRLKDISDILMDTGLGIRNYSVMEQGKIDLILSNKPQDRRKLIEEAAGITRYKAKRRAAELKLEQTQANLLRIDDTLSELTRSLGSLKRQAAKARRHETLMEELSTAKRSLYAGRVHSTRAAVETARQELVSSTEAEKKASEEATHLEQTLAEARRRLTERSVTVSDLRDELGQLNAEIERVRTFLEESEKSLSDLDARSTASTEQIDELEKEASEQQGLIETRLEEVQAAVAERDQARERSDRAETIRIEKGDAVRTHETRISELREKLMRTIADISEARNQAHQIDIAVEKCEFYLGKLDNTAKKAREEKDSAESAAQNWASRLAESEKNLEQLREAALEAEQRETALRDKHTSIRADLASARDNISRTTYQIDSLRTLLSSLETQEDSVRSAILESLPEARAAADSVRAEEGFEKVLDTVLRHVTRAVVVSSTEEARGVIEELRERGSGRAHFVALDRTIPVSQPGELRPVASVIAGDGPIADAVRAAIPSMYLADSIEHAVSLSSRHPEASFVTRQGDVIRGSLISGGASADARGFFSVKRELQDLEETITSEKSRASELDSALAALEKDLATADDARVLAEEHSRRAESELADLKVSRDRSLEELERISRDFETTREERRIYEEEKDQLAARKSRAIKLLEETRANEEQLEADLKKTEQALVDARAEFESATEEASGRRVDLEAASGKLHTVQREHENLVKVIRSIHGRIGQLKQELDSIAGRQGETREAIEQSRQKLETLQHRAEEGSERRLRLDEEIASLEKAVADAEKVASEARQHWNATREALFENERKLDRAQNAVDILREQVEIDLHVGLESLAEITPPDNAEEEEALRVRVENLTEKVEKIGPVNVLAIDEHDELETRESFLRTQRDDLVESINSLRSTIRKINTTSRELFREAFTAINENFGKIFVSLFGGGSAAMQLLDEDDILESGIEIHAQPAGKKTNIVGLLSGGERALTALALLFAIFRYKPSPFCILDEVDAPLDEINNQRFVKLLREMSHDTQFVVITHKKPTMEAADVLYGVTMEEAGCSKLVSVSFAEVEA